MDSPGSGKRDSDDFSFFSHVPKDDRCKVGLDEEVVEIASHNPRQIPLAIMKRKLDQNEEPSPASPAPENEQPSKEKQRGADPSFGELGLDARLVQGLAKQKFEKPTLVQRKVIPLALDGQDVLAKAPCGSGKTAAYVLPLLSAILKRKSVCTCFAVI